MSFKIHQQPQVDSSAKAQLDLKIEQLRRDMKNPYELIEHVIKLYDAEFVKANDRIAALERSVIEQKKASDELFKLKQKVVIANRQLMQRNHELEQANSDLRSRFNQVAQQLEGAAIDFSRHQIIRRLLDVEAHKVRAEDTPA